jgi:hypothetical protein
MKGVGVGHRPDPWCQAPRFGPQTEPTRPTNGLVIMLCAGKNLIDVILHVRHREDVDQGFAKRKGRSKERPTAKLQLRE